MAQRIPKATSSVRKASQMFPTNKVKGDLAQTLDSLGYLSANAFCAYLKQYHPHAYISYPTLLKLIESNQIFAVKYGTRYRIDKKEILRWVTQGNSKGESDQVQTHNHTH